MSAGEESVATVVVADDYPLYVEGLCRHLERDSRFRVVGVASNAAEAIAVCSEHRPTVALVGYFLAGKRGADLLHSVMASSEHTRIVVLAGIVDPEVVHTAVAVGASGYLVKLETGPAIVDALVKVTSGGTAFSPAAEASLVKAVRTRAEESDSVPSPRESEILHFLAGGATSREVAERLYLSEATVKSHLNRLYRKLGVNDRSAAVAQAMRRDWVS